MATKAEKFIKKQQREGIPEIKPGDVVCIHQKVKEKGKEKVHPFEGLVLAKKHGKGVTATITVRRIFSGVGVEKIIPIHSPTIQKIEILNRAKTKRAKLYYLREAKGRKARLKKKEFEGPIVWEEPAKEKSKEEKPEEKKEEKPEKKPEEEKKE